MSVVVTETNGQETKGQETKGQDTKGQEIIAQETKGQKINEKSSQIITLQDFKKAVENGTLKLTYIKPKYWNEHENGSNLDRIPSLNHEGINKVIASLRHQDKRHQLSDTHFNEMLLFLCQKGAIAEVILLINSMWRDDKAIVDKLINALNTIKSEQINICAYGLLVSALAISPKSDGETLKLLQYLQGRNINFSLLNKDYSQSISSCDEAQAKTASSAYELVCEQRVEPATKSQLERRREYSILYYFVINGGTSLFNSLKCLLSNGAKIAYLEKDGRNILDFMISEENRHFEKIPGSHFYSLLQLFLENGANPLCGFGKSRKQYLLSNCLALRNNLWVFMIDPAFRILSEFGAGLVPKGNRRSTSGPWEYVAYTNNLKNCVMHLRKKGANIEHSEIFENRLQDSEIFLIGKSVTDNKEKDSKETVADKKEKSIPVLIYTLADLEAILNGTQKSVTIPNIDIIARYVFEADEDDLAPGLKNLFKKYKPELDSGFRIASRYEQYYLDFQKACFDGVVTCKGELAKFDDQITPIATSLITEDIKMFRVWISSHFSEVLTILAKKGSEENFFETIKNRLWFSGDPLLNLISVTNAQFVKDCGPLLLFYSIKNLNIRLFRILMQPEIIPLLKGEHQVIKCVLGKFNDSPLQVVLRNMKGDAPNRDFDAIQEIWDMLIHHSDVQHQNKEGNTALTMFNMNRLCPSLYNPLIQKGANPFVLQWGYRSILDVIGLRLLSMPGNEFFQTFILCCEKGAGLIRKELRVWCCKDKTNDWGWSEYGWERNDVSKYMNALQTYGSKIENKEFAHQFFTSEIVICARSLTKQGTCIWVFSLDELRKIINGECPDVYLPNLEQIRSNLREVDDAIVSPEVQELFIPKLKTLDKALLDFQISTPIRSIITSYANSFKTQFLFNADSLSRDNPSRNRTLTLTREKFIEGQYNAWCFEQKEKTDILSEFRAILKLDDNDDDSLLRMQTLIDNGLHSIAILQHYEGKAIRKTILMKKIKYLELLIKANFDVNLSFNISRNVNEKHFTRPIVLALSTGYMPAVKLLVDSGANLNVQLINNRHPRTYYHLLQFATLGGCLQEFQAHIMNTNKEVLLIDPDWPSVTRDRLLSEQDDPDLNNLAFLQFIELVLKKCSDEDLYYHIVSIFEAKKYDRLKQICAAKVNINCLKYDKKEIPLSTAFIKRDLIAAKILIDAGSQLFDGECSMLERAKSAWLSDNEKQTLLPGQYQEALEAKKIAEAKRNEEANRIAEAQRIADEKRIAEEKRIAKEKRIAEEKRIVEEKRIAETKGKKTDIKDKKSEIQDKKRDTAVKKSGVTAVKTGSVPAIKKDHADANANAITKALPKGKQSQTPRQKPRQTGTKTPRQTPSHTPKHTPRQTPSHTPKHTPRQTPRQSLTSTANQLMTSQPTKQTPRQLTAFLKHIKNMKERAVKAGQKNPSKL